MTARKRPRTTRTNLAGSENRNTLAKTYACIDHIVGDEERTIADCLTGIDCTSLEDFAGLEVCAAGENSAGVDRSNLDQFE